MSFELTNTASYLEKKGDTHWWEWTAFIDASSPSSLEDIEYVEYHLHSTFKTPVVRVRDSANGFAITRKGWGTFKLIAKLIFKSGKKPLILSHELNFKD